LIFGCLRSWRSGVVAGVRSDNVAGGAGAQFTVPRLTVKAGGLVGLGALRSALTVSLSRHRGTPQAWAGGKMPAHVVRASQEWG
jgi:hypothetical protein